MPGRSNLEDISVELVFQTEKAWCVTDGRRDHENIPIKVWVPKSQCELEKDANGKTYTLTAPEWLLKDKGLI